jgi:phospholipid/cholesterol/gamma-HCH transport system substrate-binding protein
MARKSTNFILGLFVILGFLLAVAGIIWVGASSFFQKGQRYISYFDESVEGLQADSSVKYRGVDVGRVEQIRVAPDNKLVGVVMKINLRGDLPKTTIAQLRAAGITGVKFIGLDRPSPEEQALSPKIDFFSEYPIIPTRPSEIQRLLAAANVILEKFQLIDTKGISDQVMLTTKAMQNFFQGKEMTGILVKLHGTAGNLDRFTGRLDDKVSAKKLDEILGGTRDSIKQINELLASVQKDLQAMKLPETVSRYRTVARDAAALTDNLQRASASLDQFLDRLKERPPDLFFGKSPEKRWNE